jgi:hypothetical protein
MFCVAVLCGGLVWLRNSARIDDRTGPVESPSDFPEPLRELLDESQCVNYVIMHDKTAKRLVVRYRWVF